MADVTGGTPPTGSSSFDVPGDLDDVYDHFGDASMFSVANAAALPMTGNWVGRRLTTADTVTAYVWAGAAWVREARIAGGVVSATTDSSGDVVVTHGLGVTPTSVGANPAIDTPLIGNMLTCNVGDVNATTFKVRFHRQDSHTSFAVNGVKFWWTAVG